MQDIKESKIKYLHVLNVDEPKFSVRLVDVVKNKDYFTEEEWGFVTPHQRVYNLLIEKGAKNIFLEENSRTIIDDYAPYVDVLFLHAWDENKVSILKVKNKDLKKCVWRTWGHDVYPFVKKKGFSFGILKHNLMAYLRRRKAKKCLTFAIASNFVDEVKFKHVFGKNVKLFKHSYASAEASEIEVSQAPVKKEKRILIGHSMYPSENHCQVIKELKKFANEDVIITLVSVYGHEEYEQEVIKTAEKVFGEKVDNIKTRLPLKEYVEFLNTIDVAILSSKTSSALGTLVWLSKLKKKVYVYGDGDLANGINYAGCKVNKIEEIKVQTFNEFIAWAEDDAQKMKNAFGKVLTKEECCQTIINIIQYKQKVLNGK
ncbi:MAG: hypothetical protein E7362_01230 [Clostridiales bacterium]|nr:hypothetical protein [Clostridiales bacterium]